MLTEPHFSFSIPSQSVFFLVAWQGDLGQMHWVRFAGQDDKKVYLMNPVVADKKDEQESAAFWSWPKMGFMVECFIRRTG
jgi:hypothetical protein